MAWSGVWVPSQRWRLVAAVKAPVPRPVVSDEGPGHSALQRRMFTETESREASQVCIRRKDSTVRVDRRRGVPKPRPRGGLSPFPGALLPGFLRPVILVRPVPSPRLVHLGILPPVRTHLSAKMDFTEQRMGREHPWTGSPWPPRSFSARMCWGARSPDPRKGKYVVSAGRLPPLSRCSYLGIAAHRE